MGAEARVIAGVTAGYLLGRTKKLRLAITVASMLAGKKISTDPKELGRQVGRLVDENPRLAELKGEITGELLTAAQSAGTAVLTNRMNSLSDQLHSRSDALRGLASEAEEVSGEVVGDEPEEPDDGEAPDEAQDEETSESEEADEPAEETRDRERPARKAATTKTAAKKPADKTAAAKKSATKKATSGGKSATGSAPRKKTAARSQGSSRTGSSGSSSRGRSSGDRSATKKS